MKRRLSLILCAAVALIALAGCQTVDTRIKEKSATYDKLDRATQDKLRQGIIDIGYTPDMIYIALGAPSERREKITKEGTAEVWIYNTYYEDYSGFAPLPYHRRVYFDPMIGCYRYYYRAGIVDSYVYDKEERIRITFRDGKAAVIEQSK